MNNYLIVTGGYTDDNFAVRWIKDNNFDCMLASDSGMEFFRRTGIVPDVIIGDFDSVNADTLDFFKKKNDIEWTKLNPMKDDTDTEAAIRLAIEKGAQSITLLGATGSRIDHVLANIELLGGMLPHIHTNCMEEQQQIYMQICRCYWQHHKL